MYYLDADYIVQEYCYTEKKGWYKGEIGQMKATATPAAGLAAVVFGSDVLGSGPKGVHIRVYYQGKYLLSPYTAHVLKYLAEAGTNTVLELANDGHWHTGDMRIAGALGATGLAAVTYYFQDQTQIRVYYQARDLSLKEHCYNNRGWFPG